MKAGLSSFLDLSRWVAALLVLVGHVRNLGLADLPAVHRPGLAIKALYFFTGFGHQAVVVFFVISGYLVGGLTLERWRRDGADLRSYAIARFSRIYTVLVPALLLGLLFDWSGSHGFDASHLYAGGQSVLHVEALTDLRPADLALATFAGNLLGLQGITVPTYGSNGPLWSLAYEWWYYWLFALAAGAALLPRRRIALGLGAAGLAALLPPPMLLWGAIWLLGLALRHWTQSTRWRPHWSVGAVAFAAAMAWSRVVHPPLLAAQFGVDAVVGLSYATLVAGVARLPRPLPLQALHHRLADMSYTVYLTHFPALVFICALGAQAFGLPLRAQPTPGALLNCAALVGVLLSWCALVASLTERHTQAIRRAGTELVAALLDRHS